ncbi:retrovirus-related Pol polyprotein from transposon 17.6 [Nephila pilipes]|uniref:Retrovirus-related Pol polyprotein from transposon 17.6 n=1 Tax=Nephila pilipes TaxID=299642 RepID=A0A8X6TG36_NEPPI|nr:retrovirus-related Pol polyprotein from transposon 17.6 [Nephila pilipes]
MPYFDDVLVASEDEDQHFHHLKQVFQRFEEYGVVLKVCKSVLRKKRKSAKVSEDSTNAFEKCKKDLAEATVLYHPAANALLAIVVDALHSAVGAGLHQQVPKGWQLLAFFSKTLSPPQRRYSAYDRELLAAYMAIKYFRHMVEGQNFILFMDHKPVIYTFKQKEDKCSPRQLRQLDLIGQFTIGILYLKDRKMLWPTLCRHSYFNDHHTMCY